MSCQQNVEYTYITGGGRCANGKQDPDEFGVDCGGACSRSCENLRYLEGEIFGRMYLEKRFDYVLTWGDLALNTVKIRRGINHPRRSIDKP